MKTEAYKGILGCYALYDENICLYVGKADCLHSRVSQHMKKHPEVNRITFYDLTEKQKGLTYNETKAMHRFEETLLIQNLNPLLNKIRPTPDPWSLPTNVQKIYIDALPSIL
jgi:excinuclease UvrABC nuclease subunit